MDFWSYWNFTIENFKKAVINDINTKGYCKFSLKNLSLLAKQYKQRIPNLYFEMLLQKLKNEIEKEYNIKLKIEKKGDKILLIKE